MNILNYDIDIYKIADTILEDEYLSRKYNIVVSSESEQKIETDSDSVLEQKIETDSDSVLEQKIETDSDSVLEQKIETDSDSVLEQKIETDSDLETAIGNVIPDDLQQIMKINYSYPEQSDLHFQEKLYKKREFYYHKIQPREILTEYADIKKFRDMACGGNFRLRSQQSLLSNFMNPDTPFRGLLIYHGTGTGKCVHPDTLISIENCKIKISTLWLNEYLINKNIIMDDDNGEWLDMTNKIYTKSYDYINDTLQINYISKIYREYFHGNLLNIILSNGLNIICSSNHMLYTYNIGWTNQFFINDYVMVNDDNLTYSYIKIISINNFQYHGYIYDLEIDKIHSYVANNIITHNTCSAIAIAENFKDQVKKYGNKIHILVGGPLIKENWRDELIKCTGETYLKDISTTIGYMDEQEKYKQYKQARLNSQQFYKIISYKSFYKKVLGQKISDIRGDISNKKSYKKDIEGNFERDISIDKIETLDNTLLIIDEAHNITDNEYGSAVSKIIKQSTNLKVILLTATPMINFADEIVQLINYIRPTNDQIERDRVYTSDKSHIMKFKENGQKYLQNMCSGYISHFRGLNPLTFAKGVDMGDIPDELLFTKLFRCKMLDFQLQKYYNIVNTQEDSLDRQSQAVSNFCFPGLNNEKNEIVGYFGKDGLNTIRTQLKSSKVILQKLINEKFFNNSLDPNEIIKDISQTKSITGIFLKKENIKFFSIKFYNALINIENIIESKNGAGTAFIYFNLVKVGIDIFSEVLNINGYLEYNDDRNYNINDNTVDAITGLTYKEFIIDKPNQEFFPATYITMTGKNEDILDQLPEIKKKILDKTFNNLSNKDGRYIKLVLGSKVMNEGITLENVKEVHIMDVYYNLSKVHQVIGRALRECKHYNITTDDNPYPKVNIYRYVVSLDNNELSTEEVMYKKAEQKYILIKETERLLKEVSFDCPINYHGNIFPEEVKEFSNCVDINELEKLSIADRKTAIICPAQCDFTKCTFKCFNDKLNLKYYDSTKGIYRKITKEKLDYTTFTTVLARNEINYAKDKIKELYKFKYVYTLDECLYEIKKLYIGEKKDLFEDFFVYKALDELIPLSENDFNNFSDIIYDKFNIPGYIIYRNTFYIFQPFEENEDVPMYYRATYQSTLFNDLSLYSYLKSINILKLINNKSEEQLNKESSKFDSQKSIKNIYNFANVIEYYDQKPEYDYIGIIDKASSHKRAIDEIIPDVFKLRTKRDKILIKKRGTGIPTLTGAVCETSKNKKELIEVAKELNIDVDKLDFSSNNSRTSVCIIIRNRLLYLEKYSTIKDKNKYTYMIIPDNHPIYKFPINLEDNIKHVLNKIKDKIPYAIEHSIEKSSNGIFEGKRDKSLPKYTLFLNNNTDISKYENFLVKMGFILKNKKWYLIIE